MTDQDSIAQLLAAAANAGFDEVTLRPVSYDPPMWQAVAKHRDRTAAWAVSVGPVQAQALKDALTKAADRFGETRIPFSAAPVPVPGKPRTRKRVIEAEPEVAVTNPAPRKRSRPGA